MNKLVLILFTILCGFVSFVSLIAVFADKTISGKTIGIILFIPFALATYFLYREIKKIEKNKNIEINTIKKDIKNETIKIDKIETPKTTLESEILSIRAMSKKPSTYSSTPSDSLNKTINIFRDLCREIIDDRKITRNESLELMQWIEVNGTQANPDISIIKLLLNEIFADNRYSQSEAQELLTTISEFCDDNIIERNEEYDRIIHSKKIDLGKAGRNVKTKNSIPKLTPHNEYLLEYVAADGKKTKRIVKYKSESSKDNILYITCFCLSAGGMRTFRSDRIESMVDFTTGEILI